jgi:MoaA/NifB/PqqE/SkfB family radical SAM enzyme
LLLRRDVASGDRVKCYNSALNWREYWHKQQHLASYPRLVQIGTNWTCNLRCNFCRLTLPETQVSLKSKPKEDLEISSSVLNQVLELLPYPESVSLTPLGEPLLYSKFGRILERHRELGSRNLMLTTNATLVDDDRAHMLVEGQINRLYISIDSDNPEIYKSMRVLGSLDKVESALEAINRWKERLKSACPELILCSTFMERNVRQMPSLLDFGIRHKFSGYSIQLMGIENPDLESEFLGNHPQLAKEMLIQTFEKARDKQIAIWVNIALRNLLTNLLSLPETRLLDGLPGDPTASDKLQNISTRGHTLLDKCHYPWYNIMIDTDGDCRPCAWAGSSFGNLNGSSLRQVWNGPETVRMRRDFLENHIPKGCQNKFCRVDMDHHGTLA